ncbi:hypothetical protein THAR02_04571 [Trichoderma harzianum]|uniref:Mid2 domain-containing protein n=1 Tax=Trichoderma harzianum TaxID=5544 RepID=A0A0F9XFK9_TRIHA|nr:hypothetical protein THAR02_04571 [Trichoderma harzianum]
MAVTNLRVNLGPLTTTFIPPTDCTGLQFVADRIVGQNMGDAVQPSPITVRDDGTCPGILPPLTIPTVADFAIAMRVMVVHTATSEHTAARTTTSSAPTSSVPSPSAPASSVPSENPLSKPSQSLPLAAKIAIGVVIPLMVILSGAACFFIYRYRRRRKLLQAGQGLGRDARGNGGDDLETPKPELPGDEGLVVSGPNGTAFRKPELDATTSGPGGLVELPAELAGGGISELHGGPGPGELDSISKGSNAIDAVRQDAVDPVPET